MIIVGIDPGISGALVAINDHTVVNWLDMPSAKIGGRSRVNGRTIADWLIDLGPIAGVLVEQPQTRPGESPVGALTAGINVGIIHGVLTALERPWAEVPAATWCKTFAVDSDKAAHCAVAQRLYPASADVFRHVTKGRADAVLIATYAARHVWGRPVAS